MANSLQIWIVDDDATLRHVFDRTLTTAGYGVVECVDGVEALERLKTATPDLIILDVDMPRLDGWATLAELRHRGCTRPVLMMTAAGAVEARVRGLELGADDYLVKPCAPAEFLARVRALIRRVGPAAGDAAEESILCLGEARIDLAAKLATKDGVPLRLTKTDYALLALLHEHAGQPVTRAEILHRVWGDSSPGEQNSHALDTHLWRLRKKVGDTTDVPQWIRNVPGIGYTLTVAK